MTPADPRPSDEAPRKWTAETTCQHCGEALRLYEEGWINAETHATCARGDYPDERHVPKERPKPEACVHPSFAAAVKVGRMLDTGKFIAEVLINCVGCGSPFRFIGVEAGIAWDRPAASIDGLELRAPIEPEGTPRLATRASFQMPEIPVRN